MRITNIISTIILMSAFAIGVASTDSDKMVINEALNNATQRVSNITLTTSSGNDNVNSFIFIVEKYVQFIATLLFEVMKIGISFGHDNPQYFTPDFIITVIKLLVWLVIISALIKPIGWLIAFLIVGVIALKERIVKKRKFRKLAKGEKDG